MPRKRYGKRKGYRRRYRSRSTRRIATRALAIASQIRSGFEKKQILHQNIGTQQDPNTTMSFDAQNNKWVVNFQNVYKVPTQGVNDFQRDGKQISLKSLDIRVFIKPRWNSQSATRITRCRLVIFRLNETVTATGQVPPWNAIYDQDQGAAGLQAFRNRDFVRDITVMKEMHITFDRGTREYKNMYINLPVNNWKIRFNDSNTADPFFATMNDAIGMYIYEYNEDIENPDVTFVPSVVEWTSNLYFHDN